MLRNSHLSLLLQNGGASPCERSVKQTREDTSRKDGPRDTLQAGASPHPPARPHTAPEMLPECYATLVGIRLLSPVEEQTKV